MVDFPHLANRRLIAYLLVHSPEDRAPEQDPERTKDPYHSIEAAPNVVARLWDDFSATLKGDCRWILYGRPVLVHPESGVVFGWAGGSAYALRLPPHERAAAIRAGAETRHHYPAHPELQVPAWSLDLSSFGPEWVFGGWFEGEELWCMAAFNAAGKL